MIKLAPFGLIFLVLPESIPLFVIFAPGIIPSTCLTESQVLKQRQKLDEARQRMSSNVIQASHQIGRIAPEDFLSLRKFFKIAKGYHYDFELPQVNKDNLSAYCRFMGLKGWGTKGMLEKRLNKHLDYLLEDDKLIAKEGIESLNMPELQHAVEERGMRSVDVNEEQLRRGLDFWIAVHMNKEQSIPRGLLVFSRIFLLNANYK
ncbi:LETM1-like protein-domain-containing protein [Zychaea mexicana]|uniref:LETM1-like protein-domain-containing protein n=1 Tax=Zychaea mexicana TaxID=64656 RepID=UPI0022FE3AAA|nr:LETM1-like protein-domain-containing protein [Zychaea mexicana]KAI9466448.1 LETM1-like protein-domain-containing protein [Zychaea mexicana]